MKKLLAFTLALMMVLSLFGCSANSGATPTETNAPAESNAAQQEDPLHFVYVSPLLSHPIWLVAKEGFEDACNDLGIQGDWVGPQGISPEEMAKLIDTAVAQKADGIITQGLVPAEPVNNAINAGIPVLVVDSDITDAEGRLAYIGKDNAIQAQLILESVSEKLDPNTPIVCAVQVAALNYEVAYEEIDTLKAAFADWPGGFEVVNISESKSDKLTSTNAWQNTFQTYPEINLAVSFAAEAGPACANVVTELGVKEDVLVYAVDDEAETLDLIRDGAIDGTVVVSFYNYGYQAAYWLWQHVTEGLTPEKVVNPASLVMVEADNVDTYGDTPATFDKLG